MLQGGRDCGKLDMLTRSGLRIRRRRREEPMPTNPGMHSVYDHVKAIDQVGRLFRRIPQCETYGTVPASGGRELGKSSGKRH